MAEEGLIAGDGWISDDSSFYGDEEEQGRLLSLCDKFREDEFWGQRERDMNHVAFTHRSKPPPDSHNIYQGRLDAWQLNETVDGFLERLPPLTTSASLCPWIWVANPYPCRPGKTACPQDHAKFIPNGLRLLQESLRQRDKIRNESSHKGKETVSRLLNQEAESLKQRIVSLAEQTNVLSGKWMLFPPLQDLVPAWRKIVECTIGNRLGSMAKVATAQDDSDDRVICIYTDDFRDTEDILRVLSELVATGMVKPGKPIYYKADAFTLLNIKSANAGYYGLQASLYSSHDMLASASVTKSKAKPQKKQSKLNFAAKRPYH